MNLATNITSLIQELSQAGVAMRVDARNRLLAMAPKGVMTTSLKAIIAEHKACIASTIQLSICQKCGSEEFIDVAIHGGNSVRRDCAKCGRTMGFPVWNPLTLH
jgi:hypothetical protein